MAQKNIIIKLPVCGEEAEIRAFARHKDIKKIDSAVFRNSDEEINIDAGADGKVDMKVKRDDLFDIDTVQVMVMLIRLGDKVAEKDEITEDMIDNMAEEDFQAIFKETEKIVGDKKAGKEHEKKSKTGA